MGSTNFEPDYVILGAGILGLTTALTLSQHSPNSKIHILASWLPTDAHNTSNAGEYCSAWAGADWFPIAQDDPLLQKWERDTFLKFIELEEWAKQQKDGDVQRMIYRTPIHAFFDNEREHSGVLTKDGKIWYEELVGGVRDLKDELVPGAVWGFEAKTFVLDVPRYLAWITKEVEDAGITMERRRVEHIGDVGKVYPSAKAVFNCTGLGSLRLGGVEDKNLFPTRGQVVLVRQPEGKKVGSIWQQAPMREHTHMTYVFPRGEREDIVLGGCREADSWDTSVNEKMTEEIIRRACKLVPEFDKPEDIVVVAQNVGLRPTRKGGARVEREVIDGKLVIHGYGIGGAGYQTSWGIAKEAVGLLTPKSKL